MVEVAGVCVSLPSTSPPVTPPGCVVGCTSTSGSPGDSGSGVVANPGGNAPGAGGGSGFTPVSFPGGSAIGVGGSGAGITVPAPSAVELTTPVAGLSFGKAPFLWPLFAALDLAALGAVALVLRKTWSKPPAD